MTLTADALIAHLTGTLQVPGPLTEETELFSTGLLDSVAMMGIIGFLEDTARIDVRPSDVTLENFDTVARILAYVRSLD
ncbi:MAG: acyl carrier protein [Rhodobacterales bacterium]|nr:acyl carrier protein [Rhodobacterales bacterium]